MMAHSWILTASLQACAWCLLLLVAAWLLEALVCRHDDREPPLIRARIPIVGHALGLVRRGVSFYLKLSRQPLIVPAHMVVDRETTNLPILTIFLGFQRAYIVNSPDLIAQVNRQQKRIDNVLPFVVVVCAKFFGMHGEDLVEMMRNPTAKGSLRRELQMLEHGLLESGTESLKEIYTNIASGLAHQINLAARESSTTLNLQHWLQEIFALSTAHALHGPENPLARYPDLVDCLWSLESGLKSLTMRPYPSVTAAGPTRTRERLVQAFIQHLESEDSASQGFCELVREYSGVARQHNMSTEFLARYTIGILAGFVINTTPATFWVIGHIAEDKELMARIRAEVSKAVEPTGSRGLNVDVGAIRTFCPLLVSTCREVLRYISSSTSTFILHEDVVLADRYLLKKGAILQIPATAIHSNPACWGPNAATFDPERFHTSGGKTHPSANRTFGGGGTLCPGRHLALDEVLAFTAMLLHTFDIEFSPQTPRLPRQEMTNMLSVKKPSSDLIVKLSRRAEMEGILWTFRGTGEQS